MPATEKMRRYAILIADALKLKEPNYCDFYETHNFIEKNQERYRALSVAEKRIRRNELMGISEPRYEIPSHTLKVMIGKWISKQFRNKITPFDCLENINSFDRITLAKNFWKRRVEEAPSWKTIKTIEGVQYSYDEKILYIAKDIDYRIAKNSAKYFFNITSKTAGAILINPSAVPFDTVKFQFKQTFYVLEEEFENYYLNNNEMRSVIRGDQYIV